MLKSFCSQTPNNLAQVHVQAALKESNSFLHLVCEIQVIVFYTYLWSLYLLQPNSARVEIRLTSTSHFSGTIKLRSSAYSVIRLEEPIDCQSIIQMVNSVGPKPEPCTIERLIIFVNDHLSPTLTNSFLSVKNEQPNV